MASPRLWPLVLGLVGGCITPSSQGPDPGYNGWGTGPGGGGGNSGYCQSDSACGTGNVCARDGECLLASQVHVIHVNWTVSKQAATTASCAAAADLDITFYEGSQGSFGFSPVPCVEGRFTIDKMPTFYSSVGLERAGDYNGGATAVFDASGTATLDLPY